MHTHKSLALLLSLTLLGAACGNGADSDFPEIDEARSAKQRITSPQVPAADLAAQVEGNNAFAMDLYQQSILDAENLFYSPHSISIALAMLYAGARGDTEAQMAEVLRYDLAQAQLHPVFNKLDLELNSRGEGAKAADGKDFRLNVVNAVWGQKGYSFLPAYLDTLALNYGAGLRLLDFQQMTEESRRTINEWVEQKTEDRIKELLPEGVITAMTRLVLTNAIYFNAAWATEFKEKATQDAPFYLLGGDRISVPMMNGMVEGSYGEGGNYAAATLPYDGDELSMLVIVPAEGAFESFEQSLSEKIIAEVRSQLRSAEVQVSLPRFELEASLPVKSHLIAMGMTDAFGVGGAADLSGIDGTYNLEVTDVLHKAFVKVNEAGTEAAAATAVIVDERTSISEPNQLIVDRPFIFLIQDHATGAILFVGRVLDPRG